MNIAFPSREFDEAAAAVCHDLATEEQMVALNELLRTNAAARDEYILRLELHSRLASDPDLFTSSNPPGLTLPFPTDETSHETHLSSNQTGKRKTLKAWALAAAACVILMVSGFWNLRQLPVADQKQATSKAVAMLNRTANARWSNRSDLLRLNAPLEPGPLRLESGLAQIVFYSGARLVVEGPAELDLISEKEIACRSGRIVAEVPTQASGFRLHTPHMTTTDLRTSFGIAVNNHETELHVFKGSLKVKAAFQSSEEFLEEGTGIFMGQKGPTTRLQANTSRFTSLFSFETRSLAAEARRYDQWRTEGKALEQDESLLLRFDFENLPPSSWQIPNMGNPDAGVSDATIVGCHWIEGRWPEKRALEFQSVNDRVRLAVPGDFDSLTLSAWVSVKGLDRKINSLFMSDGFAPGTIHWLIRRDGVLGLTVIGAEPRNHQIVLSPPVVTLEKFGLWLHLAVVLDADSRHVVHYINGVPVSEQALKIEPPFRIGSSELGNWNAKGFPEDDPFMIRNFSGAMDEFLLFSRALTTEEIYKLYVRGKPQGDTDTR